MDRWSSTPIAIHARHDDGAARAIFLFIVRVTDSHGVGAKRVAIDANAARGPVKNLPALS